MVRPAHLPLPLQQRWQPLRLRDQRSQIFSAATCQRTIVHVCVFLQTQLTGICIRSLALVVKPVLPPSEFEKKWLSQDVWCVICAPFFLLLTFFFSSCTAALSKKF
jgi:hypothetical protein